MHFIILIHLDELLEYCWKQFCKSQTVTQTQSNFNQQQSLKQNEANISAKYHQFLYWPLKAPLIPINLQLHNT